MFVSDFSADHGVLAVEAASIAMTPLLESSAASGEFLQNSNQSTSTLSIEIFPGDVPWPK